MTAPDACPACGAAVRADSPWCTLCYADLRPKPESEPESVPVAPAPDPLGMPLSFDPDGAPLPGILAATQPGAAQPGATLPAAGLPAAGLPAAGPPAEDASSAAEPAVGPLWPCTSCGATNPMDRDTCASCGTGFLAGARDESPLLELPVVGDITKLGRGQRLALAGGVVLAIVLLILLLSIVFS